MTEDNNELHTAFNAIIDVSYLVHTRELLIRQADLLYRMYPFAKQWTFKNIPDYIFDKHVPIAEFVDLVGFGIDAYSEMRLLSTAPWQAGFKLTEETTNADGSQLPNNSEEEF